eukprot:TRINITY_DN7103_c0_g1_i1.p1 TRINITY_DN7103_c0_g1~~TRINITY_DN7103_c0_g1_i1.p1  ORF type:complete len:379 (+),score=45.99 TRINITY_DN7103_c0_g1_i1:102-1139(+)
MTSQTPSDAQIDKVITISFEEDIPDEDVTTNATIDASSIAHASMLAKADGVLAGCLVVERVFHAADAQITVTWEDNITDGCLVAGGQVLAHISGNARAILTAERTALNLCQRMSGIATATNKMVCAVRPFTAVVLDTRKTVPGLRALDKWAVVLGGGMNHRHSLSDMVMIKDNHIAVSGGLRPALERVHRYLKERRSSTGDPRPVIPVEVEAGTLDEVREAIRCHAEGLTVDRLMLDNMAKYTYHAVADHHVKKDGGGGGGGGEGGGGVKTNVDVRLLAEAVEIVGGRIPTEASGNVTLETIHDIASTGVTYISSGALTHSVIALDISLNVQVGAQRVVATAAAS